MWGWAQDFPALSRCTALPKLPPFTNPEALCTRPLGFLRELQDIGAIESLATGLPGLKVPALQRRDWFPGEQPPSLGALEHDVINIHWGGAEY